MRERTKCNQCDSQFLSSDISSPSCAPLDKVVAPLDKVAYLKPLSNEGSGSPHTNKTNKTLSLLDKKEREKFLEFAMKKVDQLPKRPQLPRK